MDNLMAKGISGNKELRISSRDVAEMMESRHDVLIKKIDGIEETLRNHKIMVSEYWIESEYKVEGNNKSYKEYQVSKKGCEMLAHKSTGEKGILFTAKYIEKFHQMENELKKPMSIEDLIIAQAESMKGIKEKVDKVDKKFDNLPLLKADSDALTKVSRRKVVDLLGGKKSPAYKPLSKKVFSDLYRQLWREFGVASCSEIKRKDLGLAKKIVTEYKLPICLENQIKLTNSQIKFN